MRALIVTTLVACGVNQTPQPEPPSPLPTCVPNRDGVIDAAELPVVLGATLAYYAGTNRQVNLAGGVVDLATESPDDQVVAIGPVVLAEQWYAGSFPNGRFVVPAGAGLDGIYHQDDAALWLDGTASEQAMPPAGKTLVVYAAPVALLRLPLHDGLAYSTTAALDATIDGLPFVGTDSVQVDVDTAERLDVPYVQFSPVLRARIDVTRTPSTGSPVINKRTTEFLFECFGEVARAESQTNETQADFTSAAYLRRFALGQRGEP